MDLQTQHAEEAKPRKNGRPIGATKLKFSEELCKQIEGLARIQCTMKEAGAVLGVHQHTFSAFLDAHKKALEAWEFGQETGKASLRRNQSKMAETNPTMAIWLGKQMLGQKDSVHLEGKLEITHEQFLAELSGVALSVTSGDDTSNG